MVSNEIYNLANYSGCYFRDHQSSGHLCISNDTAYGVYATYKILQSLLFVWWFYRQIHHATHWKACWSRLYAWNIEDLLSKVLWSIQWSITTLQYSPFTVFVWPNPLLMCVAYTGFDLTGYDWLYSWLHNGCLATSGEIYSSGHLCTQLGFPEIPVTFIPDFVIIVDFRMTDCYFLPYNYPNIAPI